MTTLLDIAPKLRVKDATVAADYYRSKLGFTIGLQLGEPTDLVVISRDHISLILDACPVHLPATPETSVAITVRDITPFYEELMGKSVKLSRGLESTDYGTREFTIEDLDGNRLHFSEPVSDAQKKRMAKILERE
jgi:uncharacterized glyoxalase superfamily protein PhnB